MIINVLILESQPLKNLLIMQFPFYSDDDQAPEEILRQFIEMVSSDGDFIITTENVAHWIGIPDC